MPRKDGREVLRDMKQDERLRSIPVIVLTTSGAREDIAEAYASGANAYIRKPVHFDDFIAAMRAVEAFWMSVASLPDAGTDASRRSG
jgi:CheY-like chemotaxis protein